MRSCAATSLLHLECYILYLHWPLSNFRNIKSIESLSKAKETNLSQLWCEIVNSASFIPFIILSWFWLPWLTYFDAKVLGNFQFLIFIMLVREPVKKSVIASKFRILPCALLKGLTSMILKFRTWTEILIMMILITRCEVSMMYWCKPYLISIDNQIYVFAEKNVCKIPHLKGGGVRTR